MSTSLNVHTKHVIKYGVSNLFSTDSRNFTRILRTLGVDFWENDEGDDFEIEREDLLEGIETLKRINNKEEDEVDINELCKYMDEASITLNELITFFEWLVEKSDQNNTTIYISYF